MTRNTFFTAFLAALLSTVAFAQTAPYIITGSDEQFTAAKDGETVGEADQPIQTVIEAIRSDANGAAVSIQFEDGENVLDIGTASASFGGNWGKITLSGKITSSSVNLWDESTVQIQDGVSVESTADIANTHDFNPDDYNSHGTAIYNYGTLSISGGTVSAADYNAVLNHGGTLSISGGTILAKGLAVSSFDSSTVSITGGDISGSSAVSNCVNCTLSISGGTILATGNFATNDYAVYNHRFGTVTISGGTILATNGGTAVYHFAVAMGQSDSGSVTISGGTISATGEGGQAVVGFGRDIIIEGGKITNEVIFSYRDWVLDPYTVLYLDTQAVEHGSPAIAPTPPAIEGYTFTGWTGDYGYYGLDNVQQCITFTANYNINTYTVTFVDWDGTEIETKTVNHGSQAYSPDVYSLYREGYIFTGWDTEFDNVTSDLTVTALYDEFAYRVTFYWTDADGSSVGELHFVERGSAAIAPIVPEIEGYTFIGWDIEFDNVTSDLTVTAEYEEITPILPPQTATNRLITPTPNGITLTAKTNATISVYNLSGKLISQQSYNAGNHSISFGHLPKGMYVVKASHGSEKEILRVTVR